LKTFALKVGRKTWKKTDERGEKAQSSKNTRKTTPKELSRVVRPQANRRPRLSGVGGMKGGTAVRGKKTGGEGGGP